MSAHLLLEGEAHLRFSGTHLDDELAREVGNRRLRLDFGEVDLLSAAKLGKLVTLHHAILKEGGEFVLDNVGPLLYEVFELTGLTRILDIRPRHY